MPSAAFRVTGVWEHGPLAEHEFLVTLGDSVGDAVNRAWVRITRDYTARDRRSASFYVQRWIDTIRRNDDDFLCGRWQTLYRIAGIGIPVPRSNQPEAMDWSHRVSLPHDAA